MSIFSSSKACRLRVDLDDSTYTIHKRIFKRTNLQQTGGRASLRVASLKPGFNCRFQAGSSIPEIIEQAR
jgi:hypothetical protein